MDAYDPDFFPFLVLKQVLGGTTRSRLFMNLRESKGYRLLRLQRDRVLPLVRRLLGPGARPAGIHRPRRSGRSSARSAPWPRNAPPPPRSRRPNPSSSATCPCASSRTSGIRRMDGPLRRPVPRRGPVGQGPGKVQARQRREGPGDGPEISGGEAARRHRRPVRVARPLSRRFRRPSRSTTAAARSSTPLRKGAGS